MALIAGVGLLAEILSLNERHAPKNRATRGGIPGRPEPPNGGKAIYQHDTDLTERFARENPGVIAGAREKLSIRIPVYRFRCPQCGNRFSIPKDSFMGQQYAEGQAIGCGDCALHLGGNYELVLINETEPQEEGCKPAASLK